MTNPERDAFSWRALNSKEYQEFSKFINKNQKWLFSKIKLVQDGEITHKKINEEDIKVGDIFYIPKRGIAHYINRIYTLSLKNNTKEVEFYEFQLQDHGKLKSKFLHIYSDADNEFVYNKNLYHMVLLGNLSNKNYEFMNWNQIPWEMKP